MFPRLAALGAGISAQGSQDARVDRLRARSLRLGTDPGGTNQNQYTIRYRPSQTTSTKCQYQAAASKPK
jgi:hypothetical protein